MNKKSSRGFTIVELLVVIVVIGILAAISIVSYSGVTAKANRSANIANAASVMKAADSYYAEFGQYPTIGAQLNTGGVVKIPTSITGKIKATTPTSAQSDYVTYVQASTGYCIQYWDTTVSSNNITTLASAGTGASCF